MFPQVCWLFLSLKTQFSPELCLWIVFLFALLCRLAPYRGWFPVICSLCCSNFVYFYCFHSLKASWLKGKQSSPSTDLIMGIAAGTPHEMKSWEVSSNNKWLLSWVIGLFVSRCCKCTGDHSSVGCQHQAEASGFQLPQCRHTAHQLRWHLG